MGTVLCFFTSQVNLVLVFGLSKSKKQGLKECQPQTFMDPLPIRAMNPKCSTLLGKGSYRSLWSPLAKKTKINQLFFLINFFCVRVFIFL